MQLATGPCVPTGDRRRPLVGVTRQNASETPEQTAALYAALTGAPAAPLALLATQGAGSLFAHPANLIEAMAQAHAKFLDLMAEDEAAGDPNMTNCLRYSRSIEQAWLATGVWPSSTTGLADRVLRLGLASDALQRSQQLYAWYGPAVSKWTSKAVTTAGR
jgi:hypothetical protein